VSRGRVGEAASSSFRPDAGVPDHLAPAYVFRLDEPGELLRRTRHRIEARADDISYLVRPR